MTIRSSSVGYPIYVASIGNKQDSIEMCYEDEDMQFNTEDDGHII